MFLKSIKLTNFRGFIDLDLSFSVNESNRKIDPIRKTTIILGANGTGKSNLLKAIALVTVGRDSLSKVIGDPDSWIQVGKKTCRIEAVFQTKAGEERNVSLEIKRGDRISKVLDRAKETQKELEDALEYTNRSYFVLGYGASRRLNVNRGKRVNEFTSSRGSRANNISTLFNPDASLTPIESWAMDMDYRNNRKAKSLIKQVLSEFLREVDFAKIDKKKKQLIFKTPLGLVPMSQLSDGYQNIAGWVGDLLYQVTETFDDYKNPLKTRGLLLIDEVDLHLHPKWQRNLLSFLRRKLPNFQVVATTHSPITAQQAGEHELHYLQRRGKSISLNPFNGIPKNFLLHQLVLSDAFGLVSDESAEMQKAKNRYEKLSGLKKHTATQKKEMGRLKKALDIAPKVVRSNVKMQQDHLELLETIKKELEDQKK